MSEETDLDVGGGFRRGRKGGVLMTLQPVEVRILSHLFAEMLELLGPDEAASDDPLAAALGIGTETRKPDDPALARLFPDGYSDDDEASSEFRRYTEPTLRAAKRSAARTALGTLDDADRRLLTSDEAEAWLRALNDTRLVLGERLGITEEIEELIAAMPEDDPRLGLLWVYDRLTYLQESLVQALW